MAGCDTASIKQVFEELVEDDDRTDQICADVIRAVDEARMCLVLTTSLCLPGCEFPVGQQVVAMMGRMGRVFDGGYADYTCVPASQVIAFTSDPGGGDVPPFPAVGSAINVKRQTQMPILSASPGVRVQWAVLRATVVNTWTS